MLDQTTSDTLKAVANGDIMRCTDEAMDAVEQAKKQYSVLFVPQLPLNLPNADQVGALFEDSCTVRERDNVLSVGNKVVRTQYGVYVMLEITTAKGKINHAGYLTMNVAGTGETAKIDKFSPEEAEFHVPKDGSLVEDMEPEQLETARTITAQLLSRKKEIFDTLWQHDERLKSSIVIGDTGKQRFTVSMDFTRLVVGAQCETIGRYYISNGREKAGILVTWNDTAEKFTQDNLYASFDEDGIFCLSYDDRNNGRKWFGKIEFGLVYQRGKFVKRPLVRGLIPERKCPQCGTFFYATDEDYDELRNQEKHQLVTGTRPDDWCCLQKTGVNLNGEGRHARRILPVENMPGRWACVSSSTRERGAITVGDLFIANSKLYCCTGEEERCYYCHRLLPPNTKKSDRRICSPECEKERKNRFAEQLKEAKDWLKEAESAESTKIAEKNNELNSKKTNNHLTISKKELELRTCKKINMDKKKAKAKERQSAENDYLKAKEEWGKLWAEFINELTQKKGWEKAIAVHLVFAKSVAITRSDIEVCWIGKDGQGRIQAKFNCHNCRFLYKKGLIIPC